MNRELLEVIGKEMLFLLNDKWLNSRFLVNKYSNIMELSNWTKICYVTIEIPNNITNMSLDEIRTRLLIPQCIAFSRHIKEGVYGCIKIWPKNDNFLYLEQDNTCITIGSEFHIGKGQEIATIILGIIRFEKKD
jgi:hypothetical protein